METAHRSHHQKLSPLCLQSHPPFFPTPLKNNKKIKIKIKTNKQKPLLLLSKKTTCFGGERRHNIEIRVFAKNPSLSKPLFPVYSEEKSGLGSKASGKEVITVKSILLHIDIVSQL